ncbi:uncharacterized protein TNCV_1502351 [Trichonephila clavipes]|uniref:Mutator-like transposase domain-containing protein n=1 Tax=Trichonephila clavipes TaxID=2585209 RepID=A0A8X6V8D0_TRICX|nr:uncharacterized protein TNCV_1502351 [Trichonephila clavipes]
MSSSLVPLKTRRVGKRCTLNLSRAQTSSRRCVLNVWEDKGLQHLRNVALAVQCIDNAYQKDAAVKSNTTPNHGTGCRTCVAMHNTTVQQPLTTVSPNSNPTTVMLQAQKWYSSVNTMTFHSIVHVHRLSRYWRRKCMWLLVKGKRSNGGRLGDIPIAANSLESNCDENKTVVNTSLKSVQTSHDVNLRITQAFSHIGKGYSAIEKFCMVMNIDPFSSTTYGKCARRLDNAYTLASENIFAEIKREIKNVYENGAEITDLSVSFDGTWLTRGHTSLIGVGCVIDMLTGYVVDFEVMSKVCRHCSVAKNKLGQSSAEFSIWYEGHKSECDINHLGSSTSMEMEAALTLWKRSTSLGFRYITVLSDGDCKTFNYLCEKKVYGPDIVIKRKNVLIMLVSG